MRKGKKNLTENQKRDIYLDLLKHPLKTQTEIARERKLGIATVSRAVHSIDMAVDTQLAQAVASQFLHQFQKAWDYYLLQIEELEKLKNGTKTILKNNNETREVEEHEVPIGVDDKIKIIAEQNKTMERILLLASQGKLVEAIRLVQKTGAVPAIK